MPPHTMFGQEEERDSARETLLEIFASANELPISLYEERNGEIMRIASKSSRDDLDELYCQAIHELPGGTAACARDECVRAQRVLIKGQEELTLCHAGLYSQAVPIKVDGVTRAALLYGEMRIAEPALEQSTERNHQRAMDSFGVTGQERARLHQLLVGTKRFTVVDLERIKATLPRVGAWLYNLFDKEDRLQRHVEDIMHELQIRLQPVMANTEILYYDLRSIASLHEEYKAAAREVLNSTLALDTVIQSMGEFLEEYHFVPRSIAALLQQAMGIYAAEAERRAVDIRLHLAPVNGKTPILEISADHLQYAFNNLVHNAVKYSFRGGPDRPRFVRISGQPAGSLYSITFENYGVGILPEEIEGNLIFKDGYQGELTRKEHRTGSGRGLHFTRRIVERHGGSIRVTSIPKGDQDERPEGQPHLNRFVVDLPYQQPGVSGE